MSSEDPARRLSHPLVGINSQLLEDAEYSRLIDRWRAITKHVNDRAANVWVGVVGHFQEPIPNQWIVDFYFTWTQRLNGLAPHFGIAVSAQFQQARNF